MYATDTKLAKSTVVHDLAIILEADSCYPLVTKLASVSIHHYDGHSYSCYETRKAT